MNLRNLSRQHDSLTRNYVQLKLQFQTILDQVFPEYKGVFGNLYSQVSLKTLLLYPTSDGVLKATTDEIASMMHSLGGKRSYAWFWDKANKLKEAAERNPFKKTLYQSHLLTLKMYIQMLLQQKIVKREREFGMKTVLPAFAGNPTCVKDISLRF